jgi:polyphosphate kinase
LITKSKLKNITLTGNFNEKTAKIYTDFGFFTTDERLTVEMDKVFQYLEEEKNGHIFEHLLVAQFGMRKFISFVENEINNVKAGKPSG